MDCDLTKKLFYDVLYLIQSSYTKEKINSSFVRSSFARSAVCFLQFLIRTFNFLNSSFNVKIYALVFRERDIYGIFEFLEGPSTSPTKTSSIGIVSARTTRSISSLAIESFKVLSNQFDFTIACSASLVLAE